MIVRADRYDWRSIDTAPVDEDVTLLVSEGRRGRWYRLPYPCRRTAAGWIDSSNGTLQTVTPIKWKTYIRSRYEK
jgi:hypothetical protein